MKTKLEPLAEDMEEAAEFVSKLQDMQPGLKDALGNRRGRGKGEGRGDGWGGRQNKGIGRDDFHHYSRAFLCQEGRRKRERRERHNDRE